MSADPVACPYCNAFVPIAAGAVLGPRLECPRCGEAFAYRRPEGAGATQLQAGLNTSVPSPLAEANPAVPALHAQRANRLVAAGVLGIMFLMATVGLAFALWTQKDRRAHDTGLGPRARRSPVPVDNPLPEIATVAPARLAALGYLPPDTNLIAGFHVAELLQTDVGRQLLTKPLKVAGFDLRLEGLERWTGLKLDDLDHIVVGLRAEDPFGQPLALVIRSRRSYDADKLRATLQAEQLPVGGDKRLDRFAIKDTSFRPVLWCADDKTLVFTLLPAHFEKIPLTPRRDIGHLPQPVQTILEERVGPVGPLWLAGHIADWTKAQWPSLLPRLKKEDLDRWTTVRTFAAWMQCHEDIRVSAAIEFRDADAARAMEAGIVGGDKGWKSARDDTWLSLQWTTDSDGFRQWLAR